jgi:hypothetical protein
LLVQAAQHVASHPGPLGHFFRKLATKKGRNIAVVATARKMAEIAWQLLRNNEPYRYAIPKVVEHKLSRLRVGATATRKKTGPPAAAPRSAQYGTGQRTKARKTLAQVCAAENIPQPQTTLRPAEAQMLADHSLSEWFAELNREGQRIARTPPRSSA